MEHPTQEGKWKMAGSTMNVLTPQPSCTMEHPTQEGKWKMAGSTMENPTERSTMENPTEHAPCVVVLYDGTPNASAPHTFL